MTLDVKDLTGLHYELIGFKNKSGCADKDIIILIAMDLKPESISSDVRHELFGVEVLFTNEIEGIVIGRKHSREYLGL